MIPARRRVVARAQAGHDVRVKEPGRCYQFLADFPDSCRHSSMYAARCAFDPISHEFAHAADTSEFDGNALVEGKHHHGGRPERDGSVV